ncbi:MAG: MMPL family transporter [Gaiellaceae bacterium]|jgi:RND superfamily putative drug exporter
MARAVSPRRFFAGLGRFVVRFRYLVVLAWVLATALATVFLPSLGSAAKNDNSAFLPAGTPSIQAARLAAPFQRQNSATAVIVAARESGRLSAADQAAVTAAEAAVSKLGHVLAVRDQGLSSDGMARRAFVQLNLSRYGGGGDTQTAVANIRGVLARFARGGLRLHLTGQAALQVDRYQNSRHVRTDTQLYSIIFIVCLLFVIFRAFLAPLVTLLPAALALVLAGPVIAEATRIGVQVSDTTEILLVVLMLGAGTDYGLFLIFRVREELGQGLQPREAVVRALERVGETITFSAATVIAALVCLVLASFGLYSGLGPALAIGVGFLLLSGLTLLPALLTIFGRAVFWPSHPQPGRAYRGLWGSIAGRIVRRPALTLTLGLVSFGGVALALLAYQPAGFSNASAPPGSDSRQGSALLAEHFAAAAANPTSIVFRLRSSFWQAPARISLAESSLRGSRLFSALAGPLDPNGLPLDANLIARLHRQLGNPSLLPEQPPPGSKVPSALYQAYRSVGQFVSADGTTVQVYTSLAVGDPATARAMRAVPSIRRAASKAGSAIGASASGVIGTAPASYDVSQVSTHDLIRIIPIVLLTIGILLALLLRSLIAPIYLILSVALSYVTALGLAVLVFVIIGGDPGLNFVLPFFMFVFLMALGEDYNILVMSRIREEAGERLLPAAVTRAVAATGTTVTSAGLILAGTFGVLTISGSGQVRQIGLGLAAGILLDTFFVRTLLVPSTVSLIGRWNWWPSKLGRRLHAVEVPLKREPA